MKKSGISQIPRRMAENTVEMRKDSAKSGNVGMSVSILNIHYICGVWAEPKPTNDLVHFSLKNLTFGGNNFNNY